MGTICCCNSAGSMKSPRAKSDQTQALLDKGDEEKITDEYESEEDQIPSSSYLKPDDIDADIDGDNSCDASLDEEVKSESKSESESESESDDVMDEKTYKRWIELAFYSFAGSSTHSKKKLYMNVSELEIFLSIVHLDNNDEDGDDLVITSDKVLIAMDKINNQIQLISCNEFCEYFCDKMVNPKCERIQAFIENQSNWILLQNALRIFDVVDVDKVKKTN